MPLWIQIGGQYHFVYLDTRGDDPPILVNITGVFEGAEKRPTTGRANWINVRTSDGEVVELYGPQVMDAVEVGADPEGGS